MTISPTSFLSTSFTYVPTPPSFNTITVEESTSVKSSSDSRPEESPLPLLPLVFNKLPGFPSISESINRLITSNEKVYFTTVNPYPGKTPPPKTKKSIPIIIRQGNLRCEIHELPSRLSDAKKDK